MYVSISLIFFSVFVHITGFWKFMCFGMLSDAIQMGIGNDPCNNSCAEVFEGKLCKVY
jgi:hypothetical protein